MSAERARQGLRRFLQCERPDVVHSNDLPTHQIVSDALRGTGIPEVCHHRWIFDGAATTHRIPAAVSDRYRPNPVGPAS